MVYPASSSEIRIDSLTRSFKDVIAIAGISLEISRGELFGLVGPDGAGKTTFLRILAGIMKINSGKVLIRDFDLGQSPEKVKSITGYMAQQFGLYDELTVVENLLFFADIYDVNRQEYEERKEHLLQFAGLTEFQDRRAAKLSGGMQKKLALACCLVHEPDILLLDEPTTGVDPVSRREFWQILSELHLQGKTIIVSTPYMDEADRCSKVGFLHEGKLIHSETPQKILEELHSEMLVLVVDHSDLVLKILDQMEGIEEIQVYGDSFHLLVKDSKKQMKKVSGALKQGNIVIKELYQSIPKMEEAFISLVRGLE